VVSAGQHSEASPPGCIGRGNCRTAAAAMFNGCLRQNAAHFSECTWLPYARELEAEYVLPPLKSKRLHVGRHEAHIVLIGDTWVATTCVHNYSNKAAMVCCCTNNIDAGIVQTSCPLY